MIEYIPLVDLHADREPLLPRVSPLAALNVQTYDRPPCCPSYCLYILIALCILPFVLAMLLYKFVMLA